MSNEGIKLPQKKKNDLLKKFLNAQQYTKTLKKSAMNMAEDSTYAAYSYDQIQTYSEIPQSAKLPSSKMFSKQLIYSIDSLNINNSHDYTSVPKAKKSHGYANMTQSSNQIPHMKSKKSSYSQLEKSQPGNKSIKGNIDIPLKAKAKVKDYDVQSMTKEKYTSEAMHQSLGAMKTDSFFKPKNKKSFNISNLHQYDSQKLSAEDQFSYERNRRHNKIQQKHNQNKKQLQSQCPYDLSPSNFMKLINKVEQLQDVVSMYQQAIGEMKKKIIVLLQQNNANKMSQIFIDSLKQELLYEKNKNAELRQKIYLQQNFLEQYEHSLIESIEKIGKFYEEEISKITILQKQNHFLKFMLRLDIQNHNSQLLNSQTKSMRNDTDGNQITQSKLSITKNLGQFKEKFTKLIQSKTKLTY